MLFNSYGFIFVFFPLTLLGFFQLARLNKTYAAAWLAAASLFFYGYWNPVYVGLLLGSVACNYGFGRWLAGARATAPGGNTARRILTLAVTANLLLLGYFKYANFFVSNLDRAAGVHWSIGTVVLPLGISFFTFTQIAYLVDTYQGKVRETNFVHYLLFVTYFPHLIAGPVLHHAQMMPQFRRADTYRWSAHNFQAGMAFFSIGLAKKVLLADSLAPYATSVFHAAATGIPVTFFGAWIGVLAYAMQIYFDFSGYSDMAIGLSKALGIDLPLNFNSPYKARNIIDFWRRWHMTLSQFLRDYLYIPLGGNRRGPARRYVNLLATMALGGLWHGANWTFVIWGVIHGVYLVINHLWRKISGYSENAPAPGRWRSVLSVAITFVAVLIAWTFFRADSASTALRMIAGMFGMNGVSLPRSLLALQHYTQALPIAVSYEGLAPGLGLPESMVEVPSWLGVACLIVWLLPNSQELIRRQEPQPRWHGWLVSGTYCGLVFALSVMSLSRVSEFLYFQF